MLKFLFGFIIIFISFSGFGQENFENKGLGGSSFIAMSRNQNFGWAENYDLKYHRMNWFVDPDTFYIEGKVTSFFVSKDDSLKSLFFELSRLLIVDSVIYRGTKAVFKHTSVASLEIILPVIIPNGMLDSVTVCYHGRPENTSGSFVKDFHDTASVIWTLSEPYGSIDWWPCKHSLNDKVDSIDVFVKTTKGNLVASNGLLVSENINGAFYTCHWKHNYPITAYLVAIAVTNYSRVTDKVEYKGDTFDILNYVYPENLNLYRNDIAHTVNIMKLFIDYFGSYPFAKEKYGHAQFGRNGGMEHQTMTFVGHFRENLVAHELAHQWFGDKVTCQSWSDIWLNEGWATFCDGLAEQRFHTPQSYKTLLMNRIISITSNNGGSVYVFGNDTLSDARVFSYRLSYQKGAMVLNTLRYMLGDSLFFLAARNYLDDPKLAYGFSLTASLQDHFEKVSGLDLEDFFKDWIYGQGFPTYTIDFYPIKNHVTVIVSQTQSDISVNYFELPLPFRFSGFKDTLVILNHTHDNQVFEVDLSFEPDSFFFNSEYQIICKGNKLKLNELNVDKQQVVVLFPNPVHEELSLMFLQESELKRVTILTTLGQEVLKEDFENKITFPGERITYKVPLLNPGSYLIKVELDSGISYEKFVKFN